MEYSAAMKIGLCIPVKNPGAFLDRLVPAIRAQSRQPDQVLVVDSGSGVGDTARFVECGAVVKQIPPVEFDHGRTRNLGFFDMDVDLCIFLTQDAIPADAEAFANILKPLQEDERIAAVVGRQIPHEGAGVFGRHGRVFNYPPVEARRTLDDAARLGVRAAFCSNSFAAYRRSAMQEIRWFPSGIIWGEDTYTAARLLSAGWAIHYAADAVVHHSHDFTLKQEFGRYFDAGVFHSTERWYLELLGQAEGEGLKFVQSELHYLRQEGAPLAVPRVLIRNAVRWLGYRAGRAYSVLPRGLCQKISHNRAYWREPAASLWWYNGFGGDL